MPVYEYECKQCHREFEYQQRMSDPEKTVCENCGGELARIISRTAFQLKGSGWYKDLYGSAKPEGAASAPLAPGLAPPMGAHEGPPTGAEMTGKSVTSDGKSAEQLAVAAETAKSKGKPSGGDSGGGSSSGSSGGGTDT
jgi:putative FmdB family regulatory protein